MERMAIVYSTPHVEKFISDNVKNAVVEGIKEAGRVFLVAVLPLLIDMLNKGSVDWRLLGITGVIAVLKMIDKYLYTYGKATGKDSIKKGLTRF